MLNKCTDGLNLITNVESKLNKRFSFENVMLSLDYATLSGMYRVNAVPLTQTLKLIEQDRYNLIDTT